MTSLRTGRTNAAALRGGIGASVLLYFWDGGGEPVFQAAALADAILVTADSVSMVSEACSTGKPVHVAPLRGRSREIDGFHEALRRTGITHPFDGTAEH